ncbi:MAG: transglutaminase-like cysteine peptidase [Nitratireductor sp.]
MKYRLLALTSLAGFLALPLTQLEAGNENTMRVGSRTSQPVGHWEYCKLNQEDCSVKSLRSKPMQLTKTRWSEMLEANNYANISIKPALDLDFYGTEEHWQLPTTHGDCEDYALLKRKWLIEQGWHPSQLLITVVRQPNGEAHALLTVRTSEGDFALDNLRDDVRVWSQTEYTYLKRVSPHHSGWWEDILDTRTTASAMNVK